MEWIKVTDRLPEHLGQYIVCLKNKYVTNLQYSPFNNIWWHHDDVIDFEKTNPVIFWMPLPEPPKE